MKLLFAQPKAVDVAGIAPGICYVASAAKKAGHQVFGLNFNYINASDYLKTLSEIIKLNDIQAVLIGGTSGDYREVEKLTKCIKSINPELIVILGGYLVSTEPEIVIQNIPADFGVIGPGEVTIVELLDALTQKSNNIYLNNVNGIIYTNTKGSTIKTKPRNIVPFDFSLTPDLSLLFDDQIKKYKHIDLVSSIGCPFSCTFCSRPVGLMKYNQRSLDSFFDELDYWINKYDINDININDELFSINHDRLREFCSRIHKYKIGFSFQGRVDMINEEILPLLKNAGCHTISYGLESASNTILSSMKKKITIEQIENTLTATRKHGIAIVGNFIFGDIQETYETACETLNWWISHVSTFDIHLTMIQPLPGSHIYKHCVENGIIRDKSQFLKDGCPVLNFSKMTNEEQFRLKRRIDNLLNIKSKASTVSATAVHEDNTMDLKVECGHCWKVFDVPGKNLHVDSRWAYDRCPHCGGHNLLSPSDIYKPYLCKSVLDRVSDELFKTFALNNKKVALWGAKERGQLLIASSHNLRKCLIKVVDSAYQSFKDPLFDQFKVDSPETLKELHIDYLIITSTNHYDEIQSIVKNDFKLDMEIVSL
jgi:anaerobic magnesium-protoporphyrin IX monomethyl ester cyclase